MLHNNIDIETFIKLVQSAPKPTIKSGEVLKICKGYYSLKPKKKLFKWRKRLS